MEASGHGRRPWAHHPVPLRRRADPQVTPWHLPCHRSMGAAPQALPCIDLSWFQPMAKMKLTRIHRPTIIDLGGSNHLPNRPTVWISPCAIQVTTIGSQSAPLDAKAVHPRADQRPYATAWRPLWPSTSLLPTSTPMPLYAINRGCGAQWKGAPFISKLSKLLLAF